MRLFDSAVDVTHAVYRCYAKINLTLEVLGKRADGFHDLASLVHTISLADDLRIEPADELAAARVEGLDIDPETNLVTRAARLLAARRGRSPRRRADAWSSASRPPPAWAAARATPRPRWSASTRCGHARLRQPAALDLAAELGSDVPFFVRGGAALMRGSRRRS